MEKRKYRLLPITIDLDIEIDDNYYQIKVFILCNYTLKFNFLNNTCSTRREMTEVAVDCVNTFLEKFESLPEKTAEQFETVTKKAKLTECSLSLSSFFQYIFCLSLSHYLSIYTFSLSLSLSLSIYLSIYLKISIYPSIYSYNFLAFNRHFSLFVIARGV